MPIIEPFATVSRNCPQRLCKLAYGEAFALFRCAATFQVQAKRVRVLGQLFFMDCPIDRNARCDRQAVFGVADGRLQTRSEEHTSELQSLMRTPYAVVLLRHTTN